jgi:hypothetical protein
MTTFIRHNWVLVLLTLATLLIIVWFGSRLVLEFIYFNDPNNVDVDLKGWMTPRFIVLTYDLPRPFVFDILELPETAQGGPHLGIIAEELGVSLDELTQRVRTAAAAFRAENP